MLFTRRLREGIRRGRIRCSVRIWMGPRVKVGGRYRMDEGHIVVDAVEPMRARDLTHDLARESGFESVDDLLRVAKHGRGERMFLVRFHYLPPGGWETPQRRLRHGAAGNVPVGGDAAALPGRSSSKRPGRRTR